MGQNEVPPRIINERIEWQEMELTIGHDYESLLLWDFRDVLEENPVQLLPLSLGSCLRFKGLQIGENCGFYTLSTGKWHYARGISADRQTIGTRFGQNVLKH